MKSDGAIQTRPARIRALLVWMNLESDGGNLNCSFCQGDSHLSCCSSRVVDERDDSALFSACEFDLDEPLSPKFIPIIDPLLPFAEEIELPLL